MKRYHILIYTRFMMYLQIGDHTLYKFFQPRSTNSLFGLIGLKPNPILGQIQIQTLQLILVFLFWFNYTLL